MAKSNSTLLSFDDYGMNLNFTFLIITLKLAAVIAISSTHLNLFLFELMSFSTLVERVAF